MLPFKVVKSSAENSPGSPGTATSRVTTGLQPLCACLKFYFPSLPKTLDQIFASRGESRKLCQTLLKFCSQILLG
jgi:hypothetical protein